MELNEQYENNMSLSKRETTGKIISALTENDRIEDLVKKENPVDLSGVSTNEELQKLLREHPGFTKRLLALYKELNAAYIVLTAEVAEIIAKNLGLITAVTGILRFFTSVDVRPSISFSSLVTLAKSAESFKNAIMRLFDSGMLNQSSLNLVCTYPELVSLPQFIIELQTRAFSLQRVSLQLEQFDSPNLDKVINLSLLLLKNDLFYYEVLEVFLRQKQYLEPVYEGVKKLISENKLPHTYFEVMEQEPENVAVFSKMISLLSTTPFFDYQSREHLLKICPLKTGAYFFLYHLKAQGMLDERCFELICGHQSVFLNNDLVAAFQAMPLLELLSSDELHTIIGYMKQEMESGVVADKISDILRLHHLSESLLPGLT